MHRWRRALITGASAGIGREFARQLASQGTDLVIVARREERLQQLARELESVVAVEVFVANLADDADVERVVRRVQSETDPIDLLINNAAIGSSDTFVQTPIEGQLAAVDVNVAALVALSHAAARRMTAAGAGTILNMSSVAGNQPRGEHAVYAATKAFVTSFSQSLAIELEGSGVGCTVVLPGLTTTEFHVANGIIENSPAVLWMRAEDVATKALAAASTGRRLVIPGALNKVTTVLATPRPGRVRDRATRAVVSFVKRGSRRK